MSLRDIFVEIGMEIDDGPLRDMVNELDDLMHSIRNGNIDDLERDFRDADRQINNTDQSMSIFKKSLLGIGGILAGLGLGTALINIGKDAVTASAEAQAMIAQFEQVFEGVTESAQETIDQLGKDFGMAPNRLKPAMAQMTSMFKGLGLDTEKSMNTASEAITLVADAAAFYDKSFEDANSSLNSFIKGNYEGGESIGLFANETQLAAFAAKTLDQDWKKLDEAGKQLARLEYAKIMQESAGATGQASRESDSLTNQMGNLKQVWQDVLAKVGEPILPIVIGYITSLSEKVSNFDTTALVSGIQRTGEIITNTAVPAFDGIKSGISWIIDNKDVLIAGLAGMAAGFVALQTISLVKTALDLYRNSTILTTIATQGFNAALRANPIGLIVTLIGLLVAAGVFLYQNWDTVKLKAGELWDKTKEVFGNIYNWGKDKIQPVTDFFKGLADKFGDFKDKITSFKLPKWVTTIGSTIGSAASKVGGLLDGSHATGLGRVPYDGYVAELHKDEAILTAEQSNALRSSGMLTGDGVAPSLSLGQDYEPLQGSPSNTTTTTNNRNSTVHAPVQIIVQGSDKPQETARSIKEELEGWYGDLSTVFPVILEG